ncbi:sorting and assembly machinery component 50 homolog B-like protein [Tanacetum coccineum]
MLTDYIRCLDKSVASLLFLARSWSLDGSLKLKNMLGYGDNWYSSLLYGWDQTTEVSTGVSLPKFMRLVNPVTARLSMLSQGQRKLLFISLTVSGADLLTRITIPRINRNNAAFQQVGAAYNHMKPRLPMLPNPMLSIPGNPQMAMKPI